MCLGGTEGRVFANLVVLPGLKYAQRSSLVLLKPVLAQSVFQLKNRLAAYTEKPPIAACAKSLPACESMCTCRRDVAMVLVPWGLSDQLCRFQRPPSEAESEDRALIFLVWTSHGIASIPLPPKNASVCQSRERTEMAMGLEGRQRLPTSPTITEDKLGWVHFRKQRALFNSSETALPLVLSHSQPHLINC